MKRKRSTASSSGTLSTIARLAIAGLIALGIYLQFNPSTWIPRPPGNDAAAGANSPTPTVAPAVTEPEPSAPTATAVVVAEPTATATAVPTPTPRAAEAEIAFILNGDLWLASADGETQQRLTEDGGYRAVRWSADGKRLAFVQGEGLSAELGVMNADGTDKRVLTANQAGDTDPVWSPRHNLIAFTRTPDSNGDGRADQRDEAEVWLWDLDAGAERKLADGRDPAWSPDGFRLAYATNGVVDGILRRDNEIRIISYEGKNEWTLVRVADMPQEIDLGGFPFGAGTLLLKQPQWRPDGASIAFTTNGHTGLVATIDLDGTGLRLLANNFEGGFGHVFWSPAGNRLAFEAYPPSGTSEVRVVDPEGGLVLAVGSPRQGLSASEPAWSPDGESIVFAQLEADQYLGLVSLDGSGPRAIVPGKARWPDWKR